MPADQRSCIPPGPLGRVCYGLRLVNHGTASYWCHWGTRRKGAVFSSGVCGDWPCKCRIPYVLYLGASATTSSPSPIVASKQQPVLSSPPPPLSQAGYEAALACNGEQLEGRALRVGAGPGGKGRGTTEAGRNGRDRVWAGGRAPFAAQLGDPGAGWHGLRGRVWAGGHRCGTGAGRHGWRRRLVAVGWGALPERRRVP